MDTARASAGTVALLVTLVVLDSVAHTALKPMLAPLGREFNLGAGALGVLAASITLGGMAALIPTAYVSQRYGCRAITVAGSLALFAGSIVFAFSGSPATLIAGRVLQGIGSGVAWIGAAIWLVRLAPDRRRSEGIGWVGAAGMLGVVAGPLVGALAEEIGRAVVFAALAAGFLFLALGLILLHSPARTRAYPSRVGSLSEIVASPASRSGLAVLGLAGVALGVLGLLIPLDLDVQGFGAGSVAGIFALASFAQALFSPLVGMWFDRVGARGPIVTGSAVVVGALLLGSTAGPYALWAPVALVAGGSLFWVPAVTLALGRIRDEPSPTGLALGTVIWFGTYSLGSLIAGWLLEGGMRWAVLGIATLVGAGAGLPVRNMSSRAACT